MKKVVSILFLLLIAGIRVFAQVGINTDSSTPDPSAMLDVKSGTKGMLVPRMSSWQRDSIAIPATGLMIFCTDNNLYYSNQGTPVSPNWVMVNSKWLSSGSDIYFSGGKVGIGNSVPSSILDIAGGNNWDLTNGEGDFRIGNSQYRLKMGMALGGGGAGAAGIMQSGVPGGYNVLSLGAQGHKLLYLNGTTQRVGIGTDAPLAAFDIHGTFALADGTQGAGKVLTSDASGVASWAAQGSTGVHTIGESYGGGIVFYVYDGGQHGLIAATADQSTGVQWWNGSNIYCNRIRNDGISVGRINTDSITKRQGLGTYAAQVCAQYLGGGFGDWYLPSKYELNLLYLQRAVVGGFAYNYYWSSSEYDNDDTWFQIFTNGGQAYDIKNYALHVRAVRAF